MRPRFPPQVDQVENKLELGEGRPVIANGT